MTFHRYGQLLSFIWPGGFIFLVGLGFLRPSGLPHWAQPLIHVFPYVVIVFGVFFCWIFSRSRIGLSLLILIIGDQSFFWCPLFTQELNQAIPSFRSPRSSSRSIFSY